MSEREPRGCRLVYTLSMSRYIASTAAAAAAVALQEMSQETTYFYYISLMIINVYKRVNEGWKIMLKVGKIKKIELVDRVKCLLILDMNKIQIILSIFKYRRPN